jgi:hypothetical protein
MGETTLKEISAKPPDFGSDSQKTVVFSKKYEMEISLRGLLQRFLKGLWRYPAVSPSAH